MPSSASQLEALQLLANINPQATVEQVNQVAGALDNAVLRGKREAAEYVARFDVTIEAWVANKNWLVVGSDPLARTLREHLFQLQRTIKGS